MNVYEMFAAVVWAVVLGGAVLLVVRLVRARADRGGELHDPSEAAFLAGGPPRVVDAALTSLHAAGRIAIGGPGIVVARQPADRPRDLVERAVLTELAAAPHGALHDLRLAVMRGPAVQEIGDALVARRLIVPPRERTAARRLCLLLTLGSFLLVFVSVAVTVADLAQRSFTDDSDDGLPVIFMVLPVLIPTMFGGILLAAYNARRLTRGGRRAGLTYRRTYGADPGPWHQVGQYGLRAVADPGLREQLVAAARVYGRGRGRAPYPSQARRHAGDAGAEAAVTVVTWCAGTGEGGSACGGSGPGGGWDGGSGGGSSCGSGSGSGSGSCSASSCSGGGASCGSSGGSSCGSSSSSSCGSSSSSSCGSSS
ncbi:TIGR04222 domain-containing membrane protein [Streptomyces sp. NPDC090025]|uniref:TIGR04222 domain-containing membrane protein n=1 Tax=Streptomyces sp. NPDC090025 TaxID=3365922 RepID=UPI0038394EF2